MSKSVSRYVKSDFPAEPKITLVNFDEYRRYDATGLAKLVADNEVSPAELLTLAQDRAAAVNPKINAIVRDVPAALPSDELSGPFAGVPFLIKDLAQDYAGAATVATYFAIALLGLLVFAIR